MELIGYSTGSIAFSDYKKALSDLGNHLEIINAVELSALRETELKPLVNDLDSLNLSGYKYISFHAPSGLKTLVKRKLLNF